MAETEPTTKTLSLRFSFAALYAETAVFEQIIPFKCADIITNITLVPFSENSCNVSVVGIDGVFMDKQTGVLTEPHASGSVETCVNAKPFEFAAHLSNFKRLIVYCYCSAERIHKDELHTLITEHVADMYKPKKIGNVYEYTGRVVQVTGKSLSPYVTEYAERTNEKAGERITMTLSEYDEYVCNEAINVWWRDYRFRRFEGRPPLEDNNTVLHEYDELISKEAIFESESSIVTRQMEEFTFDAEGFTMASISPKIRYDAVYVENRDLFDQSNKIHQHVKYTGGSYDMEAGINICRDHVTHNDHIESVRLKTKYAGRQRSII